MSLPSLRGGLARSVPKQSLRAQRNRLTTNGANASSRYAAPLPGAGESSSRPIAAPYSTSAPRRLACTPQRLQATAPADVEAGIDASADQVTAPTHADAVVLGGGVVGLALAASLVASSTRGDVPLRIVLLEASDLGKMRSWAQTKGAVGTPSSSAQSYDGIEWENRVVSLTLENWNWLQDIGVMPYLVHERIKPISSMHVTDGVSGAALDLGQTGSLSPLSKMVELSNLQQGLLRFLDDRQSSGHVDLQVWDGTKVEGIEPDAATPAQSSSHSAPAPAPYVDAWPILHLSSKDSAVQHRLRPRLLIGADGPNSPVRKYAGIQKYGWAYDGFKGLVGTMRFDASQSRGKTDTIAYQRFLPTGTIAWLPLSDSAASMVWTLPPHLAQAFTELHRATPDGSRSALSDLVTAAWRLPWSSLQHLIQLIVHGVQGEAVRQEVAHLLQTSSGLVNEDECPPAVDVGIDGRSVASFPLQMAQAEAYLGSSLQTSPSGSVLPEAMKLLRSATTSAYSIAGGKAQNDQVSAVARSRTVLVGDAAHSIHPLAGQGLNLGLADARSLCSTLSKATEMGGDWGSHDSLKAYEDERWMANQLVITGVDRLHYIYTAPVPTREGGEARPGLLGTTLDTFYGAKLWARSTGVEVLNELDFVKSRMQSFAGSEPSDGPGSHGKHK